jgi:enoyl-CoA hydratase/carnithine racemase
MAEFSTIKYEVGENGVAVITFNRPDQLNALSHEMASQLFAALDLVDQDPAVRVVILTGEGRGFCAGTDLSAGPAAFKPATEMRDGVASVRDTGGKLNLRIFEMTKPTIAAINGASVGLGATLTLPCDIRIASTTARFGFVFSRRGIVTEGCSSWFLPRVVGVSTALRWTLSGALVNANDALAAGLVSAVHEPTELMGAAHAIADELASQTSPLAISLIRQLIWRGLTEAHPMDSHRYESALIAEMTVGPEALEGVNSFLEKRPPRFASRVPDDLPVHWPPWEEPTF